MIESIFGSGSKKKAEEQEKKEENFFSFLDTKKKPEEKKKKEDLFSKGLRWASGKNIAKLPRNPLEYAKPLGTVEKIKEEIERKMDASKILSPEQGGPTKEELYATATKVAKEFSQKDQQSEKKDKVFEMGNDFVVDKDGKITHNDQNN